MSYYSQPNDETEAPRDRELTLSTTTILGIFFGLVLLCGACVGLGYNLGAHSHPATTTTEAAAAGPSDYVPVTGKPSAGAPAIQPVPGYLSDKDAATLNLSARNANSAAAPSAVTAVGAPPAPRPAPRPVDPDATLAGDTPAAAPEPRPVAAVVTHAAAAAPAPVPNPYAAPPGGSTTATGSYVVQVAAVSHAEDADLLVSALKAKGYAVGSHTSPADKFFHIQIGPFPTKPSAEATRQRLLTDGYNAIVK